MKDDLPKRNKKQKDDSKGKKRVRWAVTLFFVTVLISGLLSTLAEALLAGASVIPALLVLLVIVSIGILFDVIGVAVTAADPKPFHAMAAHRVPGAKEALKMLKNADRVSSFCNDVIGDICGILSGAAAAAIAVLLVAGGSSAVPEILLAALVSGLTVGGKAAGKALALEKSTEIVHTAARVIHFFKYLPKAVSGLFHRKQGKQG